MILDDIVLTSKRAVSARAARVPLNEMESLAARAPASRPFGAVLRGSELKLIAEFKRSSPTRGIIRSDADPAAVAQAYSRGGASALSVLTEPAYFGAKEDDLARARGVTLLPVLRKDFIVSEYQVYESRAMGADAILLIATILSERRFRTLFNLATSIGLEVLAEIHDQGELRMALRSGATVVGVNNRDLRTMRSGLEATARLRPLIPPEAIVVSESGIRGASDVERLRGLGVDAVLVGEALMASDSPEEKVRELLGTRAGAVSHA